MSSVIEKLRELRGALDAQDQRERQAGEKCGVSWLEHGCDWPDAAAEKVLYFKSLLRRWLAYNQHTSAADSGLYAETREAVGE